MNYSRLGAILGSAVGLLVALALFEVVLWEYAGANLSDYLYDYVVLVITSLLLPILYYLNNEWFLADSLSERVGKVFVLSLGVHLLIPVFYFAIDFVGSVFDLVQAYVTMATNSHELVISLVILFVVLYILSYVGNLVVPGDSDV
jgi:hypothetical protein